MLLPGRRRGDNVCPQHVRHCIFKQELPFHHRYTCGRHGGGMLRNSAVPEATALAAASLFCRSPPKFVDNVRLQQRPLFAPSATESANMKRKVGALEKIEADLPSLQHRCRSDPQSYRDDFQNQYNQYETFRELFLTNPTTTDGSGIVSLRTLIDFVTHCADACMFFA